VTCATQYFVLISQSNSGRRVVTAAASASVMNESLDSLVYSFLVLLAMMCLFIDEWTDALAMTQQQTL